MKYIGYIAFWVSSLTYAKNLVAIDGNKTGLPSPSNISNITSSMKTIIGILQDITAIVAVIGICIVGIMYIMSHGSEEKTEAAKKYMITILIWVLLAFAAWGMMSLINIIPNSFTL